MIDQLNQLASHVSQTDMVAAAAFLAVGVQYAINRFRWVQKSEKWLLSFLLPYAVLIPTMPLDGLKNLKFGPVIYLVAQIVYYTVEKIKASASATVPTTQEQV